MFFRATEPIEGAEKLLSLKSLLSGDMPLPPMIFIDPIEAVERAAMVKRAVNALSERQRTAVILHRYQELSHSEIAAVTGWSPSAVESLLVRAYANLREALAELRN